MALVSHIAKTDAAFIPLITLSGMILTLYAFALCDQLSVAVPLLCALGLFSFGFFLIAHRSAFRYLLSPGFFAFLLLSVAIAIYAYGKMPHQYDNYTHWALMMKTMWQTNALPQADSLIVFTDYPPATALLGYFGLRCIRFGEDIMVASQGLLAAAALAALFAGCRFRSIGRIFVTLSTAALMIALIPDNLSNLYVDALLGYLAVAACAMIFYHVRTNSIRPLSCAAVLSVLILTKASGAFFVICIAVIALFLRLCCRMSMRRFVRAPISLIACAGIPFFIRQTYVWYGNRTFGVDSETPFDASYSGFLSGTNAKSADFLADFPSMFQEAITDLSEPTVLVAALLLLCAILLIPFCAHIPESGHRCALCASSIVVTLAYAIGLYLMYIGVMPEDESLQLASFSRYLGTGTIFQLGFLFIALWSAPPDKIDHAIDASLYLLLFPVCLGLVSTADAQNRVSDWEREQEVICADARLELKAVYEEIAHLIPASDTLVYVIDDRVEPGYYYHIMRYTFMRRYVWPLEPWCVEDDLWGPDKDDCLILILHEGKITTDYLNDCFGKTALTPGLYKKHADQLTLVYQLSVQ